MLYCTLRNKKSRIYGTSDQSISYDMICLICQICQRVRSVRESDLWGRGSPKWEAEVRVRSVGLPGPAVRVRSSGQSHLLPWNQRDWPGKVRLAQGSDSHGRPWEADRSDSHFGLSPQSHVICQRVRSASHGLPPRTPTASQLRLSQTDHVTLWWEAGVRVRSISHGRPIGLRARQCDPRARLTDFTAKRIASPGRVWSASQIGLSWEAVLPDWLRQVTWQNVGGRLLGRPNFWEAMGGRVLESPKVGGCGRPCSPDWITQIRSD